MIFNAYSDSTDGLFGISLISAGHIFAQNGRNIVRPKGREDWLLFYVAKGSEHFFLDEEAYSSEGSFIFFKPRERQEHFCAEDKTSEVYYIHFVAPPDFDLFGFDSSRVYSAKPSTKVRDLFEQIIDELQTKQKCYEKICVSKLFNIMGLLSRRASKLNDPN